jgi:hypothetical protein
MPFTKDTAREAGAKGGTSTKLRHGLNHFVKTGKKGLKKRWKPEKDNIKDN